MQIPEDPGTGRYSRGMGSSTGMKDSPKKASSNLNSFLAS